MDFNRFEEMVKRKYVTRKTDQGLILETETGTYEVLYDETADYNTIYTLLGKEEMKKYNVGETDLYPSGTIGTGRISGSKIDPKHPFFTRKVPEGARFDPIRPSKDKSKGWDPTPDHFKKPDYDDDLFD